LAQSYYRYLYTYNKYCFAEQTLAARKQEVELASSASEQQRATADLAQAQTEVEAAKDDMRSAQAEMAQNSSPTAARSVIAKVSGVTPNLESLAQRDNKDNEASTRKVALFGNVFNPFSSVFKFGHDKKASKENASKQDASKVDASKEQSDTDEIASVGKSADSQTSNKGPAHKFVAAIFDKKNDKTASHKEAKSKLKIVKTDNEQDLAPAPKEELAASAEPQPKPVSTTPSGKPATSSQDANLVSFTLKGVNVTSSKAVLTVAIKNTGADAFNFNPDSISVAEGHHKLSEAATRADFDTTMVKPNEEVQGKITIFGRPWSDKLTVGLLDGSKAIQMRR
jgi:hypothetical protein